MTSFDSYPFCIVVAAGGRGRRLGSDVPKQFQMLSGVPILVHTLRKFESSAITNRIILVLPEDFIQWFEAEILSVYAFSKLSDIVAGGETRQESVYHGLRKVDADKNPFVAIHDGVRPFFDPQCLEEGLRILQKLPAVVVGAQLVGTVKQVSSKAFVTRTLKRESLCEAQTPQMFHTRLIQAVHEDAREKGWVGSDDATLMERAGYPVRILPVSRWNTKITEPEDLKIGEVLLNMENKLFR